MLALRSLWLKILAVFLLLAPGAEIAPVCHTQTSQDNVYGGKHGERITITVTTCN
jgi:hypothetical protein